MSQWVGRFATTKWTLIRAAATEDPGSSRPAFAELFSRYWQPLFFVARRQGWSPEDAEDAIQQFFASLLCDSFLHAADPASGRFRSYLTVAWKRYLIDDYRRQTAQKRGGKVKHLSLDIPAIEAAWQARGSPTEETDRLFVRAWADSLLAQVYQRLADEYATRGRRKLFERLFEHISDPLDADGYARLAADTELTPGAVKVALHRLRRRFGESLHEVISETVSNPAEIEAELDDLLAAMR